MPFSHIPHMSDKGYVEARRQKFMQMIAPFFDDAAMEMIEQSYFISKNAHCIQVRDDGTRYFEHPKTVAWLVCVHFGIHHRNTIIKALLHDMIEDSFIMKPRFIRRMFNKKIMHGVIILSKNTFDKEAYVDKNAAYYNRFITDGNWSDCAIKLCDRIHNIRTMDGMDPSRVERKLAETERYFEPIKKKLCEEAPKHYRKAAYAICAELESCIAARREALAAA